MIKRTLIVLIIALVAIFVPYYIEVGFEHLCVHFDWLGHSKLSYPTAPVFLIWLAGCAIAIFTACIAGLIWVAYWHAKEFILHG